MPKTTPHLERNPMTVQKVGLWVRGSSDLVCLRILITTIRVAYIRFDSPAEFPSNTKSAQRVTLSIDVLSPPISPDVHGEQSSSY